MNWGRKILSPAYLMNAEREFYAPELLKFLFHLLEILTPGGHMGTDGDAEERNSFDGDLYGGACTAGKHFKFAHSSIYSKCTSPRLPEDNGEGGGGSGAGGR